MGCAQSRELGARAPRRMRFILLGSFSDTLLVVLILDMMLHDVDLHVVLSL